MFTLVIFPSEISSGNVARPVISIRIVVQTAILYAFCHRKSFPTWQSHLFLLLSFLHSFLLRKIATVTENVPSQR